MDRRSQGTRFDRLAAAALPAAAILFVLHRSLVPMAETDLFFHLKLGDVMLATRAIPFRNLFSFTYPDHPDLDLAWAFQVGAALLYRLGGFTVIVLGKAALAGIASALLYRVCRASGGGPALCASAVAAALCASEQRLVERPHLVTWVGLGALQLVVLAAERKRPALLWLLPPLCLVWANFHAGVFLAPLWLALYFFGAWLDARLFKTRLPGSMHPAPRRALLLALASIACIATPAGLRLLPYLLWHTGLGATRIIEEFRRADPWDDPWFFLLVAGSLLALFRLGREVSFKQALPAFVIALLAWRSVRFVAEWSFIAAPLVVSGFAGIQSAIAGPATDAPLTHFKRPAWRRATQWVVCLLITGTVVWERRDQPLAGSLGLAADVVPFDAIEFVTRNGLRDRLYHDLDVGCYLLWEGWPRYRVFQDARLPAYPDEFHRALDQTPLAPTAWNALLSRYDVDAALINYPGINMRAGSFDPEEWALVYRADDALVFARRVSQHAAVIARYELPLRIRFTFARGSSVEAIASPPARSPVSPEEWSRRRAQIGD